MMVFKPSKCTLINVLETYRRIEGMTIMQRKICLASFLDYRIKPRCNIFKQYNPVFMRSLPSAGVQVGWGLTVCVQEAKG